MRLYPLYLLTDAEKFGIVAAPSTRAREESEGEDQAGDLPRRGGPRAPHREVSIQRVTVNPLTLSLTIRGFLAKDREAPDTFVSIDELFANLEGIPASQRAMKVQETILKSGKIEPARVFVVEPKSLSPERRETVRDSRVDFRLR